MSRTGEGKQHLVECIREDLNRVHRKCELLANECEELHVEARGLNGWPAVWRGVSKLLRQASAQLREAERTDLPKLESGAGGRITASVDHERAQQVGAVRQEEGKLTPDQGDEADPAEGGEGADREVRELRSVASGRQ